MECKTTEIPISSILVSTRIRKDTGNIDALAMDLQQHGLINPITVMDCQNGSYQLIAGLRRLQAAQQIGLPLIRTTVLSPMQAEEMLAIEIAENEQRLNFTTAERLEYAEKIKAIEQAKARERMALYAREGYENDQGRVERSYPDKGRVRDAIAKRVGFSSGSQFERAEAVAKKRPDLLAKIDSGEASIYGAYKAVKRDNAKPEAAEPPEKPKTALDQVARAGIERLMKNPHFLELLEELGNMRAEATIAKTQLKRATEAYDNKVKHFENNVDFLSRRVRELEKENAELRARLGMEARHVKRVEFGNPDGVIGIPSDSVSAKN
jgi:ParB family chromosome partitioning protein